VAILCLGTVPLRLDGYRFIRELALDGSVRLETGVLPMARRLLTERMTGPEAHGAPRQGATIAAGGRVGVIRGPSAERRPRPLLLPDGSRPIPFPGTLLDQPDA
jgi:hypothetical protein